jgi:hypothetical protein
MIDEFTAPLGQHRPQPQRARSISIFHVGMGTAALAVILAAGWGMAERAFHPRTDEVATAPVMARAAALSSTPASLQPLPAVDARPEPVSASQPPSMRTVSIIDGTTGNRREVVIPEMPNLIGFDQQLAEQPLPTPAALGASARMPAPRPRPAR